MNKISILYILSIAILKLAEFLGYVHLKKYAVYAFALMCVHMLFTRAAFPSHWLSSMKSIERLSEEQLRYPPIGWKTFFIIIIPLALYFLIP